MAASGTVFTSGPHLAAVIAPGPAPERGFPYNLHVMAKEQRIAYGAGKAVVVRSLANPADCFVYKGHNQPVTCAKFAPNGFWVASGDASGHVRVWAWDHPEHLLKGQELAVMACPVKDIDWDPDSKRIVAVGDGTNKQMKVFMWDTGNTVGEIAGHSKRARAAPPSPPPPMRAGWRGGAAPVHFAA